MAGEKYVVAAADNPFHIAVRNALNPEGYIFLDKCSDYTSLIRLARNYAPDFIIADAGIRSGGLQSTFQTIDEEMLCPCIIVSQYRDADIIGLMESTRILSFCPKPLNREMLLQVVEMSLLNFKRISNINKKLVEMTENYETRKVVERAKWILMNRDGITEDEAYKRIRRKSMDTRLSIKAIADAIICAYEVGSKGSNK